MSYMLFTHCKSIKKVTYYKSIYSDMIAIVDILTKSSDTNQSINYIERRDKKTNTGS